MPPEGGPNQAEAVVFAAGTLPGNWPLFPGTLLSASLALRTSRLRSVEIDIEMPILDDAVFQGLARSAGLRADRLVNVTEGLDVPAYVGVVAEAVAELGQPPDVCVVPYGAGMLCNEIRDYLQQISDCRVVPLSVATPESRARMLYGPVWLDTQALSREGVALSRHHSPDRTGAIREPYRVYAVSEEEIVRGLEVARQVGLSAEPSGAVGLGVLGRLPNLVPGLDPEQHIVLVINTGNGIDGFLNSGTP